MKTLPGHGDHLKYELSLVQHGSRVCYWASCKGRLREGNNPVRLWIHLVLVNTNAWKFIDSCFMSEATAFWICWSCRSGMQNGRRRRQEREGGSRTHTSLSEQEGGNFPPRQQEPKPGLRAPAEPAGRAWHIPSTAAHPGGTSPHPAEPWAGYHSWCCGSPQWVRNLLFFPLISLFCKVPLLPGDSDLFHCPFPFTFKTRKAFFSEQ